MEERGKISSRTQIRKYRKKQSMIKIVRWMIGFFIIAILIYMAYGIYQEMRIRVVEEGNSSDLLSDDIVKNRKIAEKQIEEKNSIKEDFIPVVAKYKGYCVDCRLEIPKINLQTNVLADYTKAGLKICASKYYGPNANEIGNYCIAGHNYKKENMFNHLIDLKIGDSVYLTDNSNGKVQYTIYDIYKVKPENVEPLSQQTRRDKEITLITCVDYSQNRLVVKAIER